MGTRGIVARGILLGLLPLLAGCVSFIWSRTRAYQPMPKGALVGLEIGRAHLDDCLERLGAPLYVWEYKRNGAALAWGHGNDDSKRIAVSIPIGRASPSVSYGDIDANLKGAVLLFDQDLVLEQVKEGYLRAIAREVRPARPAAPLEDVGEEVPAPPAESKP